MLPTDNGTAGALEPPCRNPWQAELAPLDSQSQLPWTPLRGQQTAPAKGIEEGARGVTLVAPARVKGPACPEQQLVLLNYLFNPEQDLEDVWPRIGPQQ